MEDTAVVATRAKPRITLSASDYERLSMLAHVARNKVPELAAGLAEEIGRAHYLDAAMALARIHAGVALDWTGDIATLGSIARLPDGRVYRVEPSGPRDTL